MPLTHQLLPRHGEDLRARGGPGALAGNSTGAPHIWFPSLFDFFRQASLTCARRYQKQQFFHSFSIHLAMAGPFPHAGDVFFWQLEPFLHMSGAVSELRITSS